MSRKLTNNEVDLLFREDNFSGKCVDRFFARDDSERDKVELARRVRKNHARRSIEEYADSRRMRKMLGENREG